MPNIQLVIIDPQNDFCDPKGSLCVPGADDDMELVSGLISRIGDELKDITVTLDSHHDLDIAHPVFWRDSQGKHPSPFTIITSKDIENGTWMPAVPTQGYRDRVIKYVQELETNGRYPLCIWPVHCVIGSWGHNILPVLHQSIRAWETKNFATATIVTKGCNPWTEHYSAIKAEVPVPGDISTQINSNFIKQLMEADQILISGEALSHCVANTFRDVADEFGDDTYVKKLVLLEDASSNVPGFENLGEAFVQDLKARGMQVSTTTDYQV